MKSETDRCLTLGKGAAASTSLKQKINTRSSAEGESVGADDVMGPILWTNCFSEEQGHKSEDTLAHQDDKSAVPLEKNGKSSSGKRTKHINVRCFFIKDRIDNGEIQVKWCPTDEMTADFFSEPLQGQKFCDFVVEIVNLNDEQCA